MVRGDPRILMAVTRLERGGAQLHVLQAARILGAAGWEVHLATGAEDALTPEARSLLGPRLHEIAPLVGPLRPAADLAARRALARLLRTVDPDLLWSHSSKAGVLARFAASGHRAHVLHSVHGFAHPGARDPVRRRLFVGLERRAAARTDTLCFYSRSDRDLAGRLGLLRRAEAAMLPYGVDLEGFRFTVAERRRAREAAGLAADRPTLAVVANLKRQKMPVATARVARAFLERSPDWQLLWAGDGPARDAVRRELAPVAARIAGPRWSVDRRAPFAAADLLLLFSRHEGLPNAVIEGLAGGVPVVASDTPGAVELLADLAGHALVPVGDEAAALRALEHAARRGPLGEAEREAGERRARSQGRPALAGVLDGFLRSRRRARERDGGAGGDVE